MTFVPATFEEFGPPIPSWTFSDTTGYTRVSVRYRDDQSVVTLVTVDVALSASWGRADTDGLSEVSIEGDTVSFFGIALFHARLGGLITLTGSLTRPSTPVEISTWSRVKALYEHR